MKKLFMLIMVCIMMVECLSVSAFAAEPGLDPETKQEYYAEYVKIAEEVGKETKLDISVLPINEFTEEDWRTPEEFRTIITAIANWRIECQSAGGIQPYSSTSATKSATITANGLHYTISITGNFRTNLNTSTNRQHFSGINSLTSKLSGSTGSWKQTGYEANPLDAARTYGITVSGELTVVGAKFSNMLAYVEFYCSSTGAVS